MRRRPRAGRGRKGLGPVPGSGATAGSGRLPISCGRCEGPSRVGQGAAGDLGSSSSGPRARVHREMPLAPLARGPWVREQRPAGKEHGRGPHVRGLGGERPPDKAPGSCVLRPLTNTPWAHAAQLSGRPPRRHFQPSWPGSCPRSPTLTTLPPPAVAPVPPSTPHPSGCLDTPTSPAAPVVRRHTQPRRTQH